MALHGPLRASVIREPSPDAVCSCRHWLDCDCGCHDLHCDPTTDICHIDYRPDEGGLTQWGCPACTPGQGEPHYLGCELIGWNVPVPSGRVGSVGGGGRWLAVHLS